METADLVGKNISGQNFPWKLKMLLAGEGALAQLLAINGNTDGIEAILAQLLALAQTSADYETNFVIDATGTKWLEIRIYNPDTSTWNAPVYFAPGSVAAGVPTAPVVYDTNSVSSATSIPTVAAVPITAWDASITFTSDIISFIGRDQNSPWSIQIPTFPAAAGTPTLTVMVSNNGTDFNPLKASAENIPLNTSSNRFLFFNISPFTHMRLVYVPNGITGVMSVNIHK